MFKFSLLISVVVQTSLAAYVTSGYTPPILYFGLQGMLQGNTYDVTSVAFHVTVSGNVYRGVGTNTTEGWQYQTRDVDVKASDSVVVYAVLYNSDGHILDTTDSVTLKHDINVELAALPGRRRRGAVIFRDDFNFIDTANWQYEISMFGGMNWEFQVYTPEERNTFIRDGILYIKPNPTTDDPRFNENFLHTGKMDMEEIWGYCTNMNNYGCTREGQYGLLPSIMSGKITSIPTLRYGIVEVRAKIPKGDWIWPAIWMTSRDNAYGEWPRSGAIQIMESRGNIGDIGIGTITSTLHWGTDKDNNRYRLTQGSKRGQSWHSEFHTYKLVWTPESISAFVDDVAIMEVIPEQGFWQKGAFSGPNIWANGDKMAPFDKDLNINLNVAVGGVNGYFPDNYNYGVRKPWANTSPHANEDFWAARKDWLTTWKGNEVAMLIDWIEFRNL